MIPCYVFLLFLNINLTYVISRFPNMVVGVLTRESVRQALRGGITADQIIHYLEQHSHPRVSSYIIPKYS